MPFAATWMDLEIITVSELKDKYHMITYMRNLKNNTNELIYKTKADSQKTKIDKLLGWGESFFLRSSIEEEAQFFLSDWKGSVEVRFELVLKRFVEAKKLQEMQNLRF